ncbi:MAG: hypothetical protein SO369_06315 [Treponema sp.]|nr:hypothetical protein [Treponema sp.]
MGAGSRGSFKSPILENFFHGDSMENQTHTENRKHKDSLFVDYFSKPSW